MKYLIFMDPAYKFLICAGSLLLYFSSGTSAKNYPQILLDLQNESPGKILTQPGIITDYEYAINVVNVNPNVSFFIVQVHTFFENITLSYEDPIDMNSFVTGTNIGLVWKEGLGKKNTSAKDSMVFYLLRSQTYSEALSILVIVSTYTQYDPIPGGCNLSFETELAPYQKVNETDAVTTVMSQPPSIFGEFCNGSNIKTEMYHLYLPEYVNSSDDYFLGIQKMMSPENITKYGNKVPSGLGYTKYKRMYNKYSGTGRVFAVVATYEGRSTAYVPAVSFGCNFNAWEEECLGPVGTHWKLVIALLFLCGLLMCLSGHRFFRTGLFIAGYTFGVIAVLLIMSFDTHFSTDGKAIFSLILGIFFGITWVFFWWLFGIPVFSVQLTFLLAGLVIASILFYTQLGDIFIFADNLSFWLSVVIVLMVCQIPSLYSKPLFHIVALSLLGSYAIVVAMCYYTGGNLPYIFINTYRRITVKDFGMAVIDPPYQLLDISQTVLWLLIFCVGIYVQHKHSLGKPPFPPHRGGLQVISQNERTPLLQPEQPPPLYTA